MDKEFKIQAIYNKLKKILTHDEALNKAQNFCAYQERCVYEIEIKLKDWGLPVEDVDRVVDELVETDFVNEKRFALSFVRGKFINNKWGRYKIKIALKQKKLNETLIGAALEKIEEKDYLKTAGDLIERKNKDIKSKDARVKRSKIYYFMVNKGYEPEIVISLLD